MARPLREQLPNGVYHVTSRAVEQIAAFRDATDCRLFLSLFERTVLRCRWVPHAYCLMTTHYHLVVQTPEANLAYGMQLLNGRYAQLFNERYGRLGHLFFRRYSSASIESDEYFAAACHYVLNNPVRAELCRRAEDWPWSGFFVDGHLSARDMSGV
jgi:REP element-mobilizing transposase RayT